jgi:hypothetical protein
MDLLTGSESSPELSIYDSINIVSGVRAASYLTVQRNLIGQEVLLPVVQSTVGGEPDIPDSPGGMRQIVGFVGVRIVDVYMRGAHSYITVHKVSDFYAEGTGDVGPNYHAYSPPRLVQ